MLANFIINDDVVSVILNGKPYTIHTSHPNYNAIIGNLKEDLSETEWKSLLDIPQSINNYFSGSNSGVEVRGNEVYYNGHPINNTVCKKILEFMNRGLPYQPLVNFLNNLMQNPSMKAVERLYDFLSHHGMAITPDGCFVGYKGVRDDYLSVTADYKTREHLDYSIGNVVEMPRNMIDDNEHNACSYGIHVGTYEYASSFGPKVLLVKVNPKDAVTVPLREITKLRCCRLEVLGECEGIIDDPMYGSYESDSDEDEDAYNEDSYDDDSYDSEIDDENYDCDDDVYL